MLIAGRSTISKVRYLLTHTCVIAAMFRVVSIQIIFGAELINKTWLTSGIKEEERKVVSFLNV